MFYNYYVKGGEYSGQVVVSNTSKDDQDTIMVCIGNEYDEGIAFPMKTCYLDPM